MKFLITGIPGTGKTTIGNYLRQRMGYDHFNMEVPRGSREEFEAALKAFLNFPGNQKVITWGFVPGADDGRVMYFKQAGYSMIWFDGNRDAARKAFLKRGTVSEELLDCQMERINAMDLNVFNPTHVDPFDANGDFLKEETIVQRIFEACR